MNTSKHPETDVHDVRIDIIVILFGGITAAILLGRRAITLDGTVINAPQLAVNAVLMYLAAAVELRTLVGRPRASVVRDLGVWSAIVTVAATAFLPVMAVIYREALIPTDYVYPLGCVIFLSGVGLRIVSAAKLGNLFDHALTIRPTHILVTTGIYSQLRHPAYLGTLLVVLGSGGLWRTYIQAVVGLLFTILIVIRIRKEEAMLSVAFGDRYRDYQKRTWAVLPFLY